MYFDNNVYNRLFDDQRILRNRAETLAILELFERIKAGRLELISSFVVQIEHSRLEDSSRRERVEDLISLAQSHILSKPEIFAEAHNLVEKGFGAADAVHLAAAECAGVDRFVTCDDKLLRRARRVGLSVEVVLPQTVLEEELR